MTEVIDWAWKLMFQVSRSHMIFKLWNVVDIIYYFTNINVTKKLFFVDELLDSEFVDRLRNSPGQYFSLKFCKIFTFFTAYHSKWCLLWCNSHPITYWILLHTFLCFWIHHHTWIKMNNFLKFSLNSGLNSALEVLELLNPTENLERLSWSFVYF